MSRRIHAGKDNSAVTFNVDGTCMFCRYCKDHSRARIEHVEEYLVSSALIMLVVTVIAGSLLGCLDPRQWTKDFQELMLLVWVAGTAVISILHWAIDKKLSKHD